MMPGADYIEPMQIDFPGEENDNGVVEDEAFVVENPSMVL